MLRLYHYQVQSRQHMQDSSMRGDVNLPLLVRNDQFWREKEKRFNVVEDRSLADVTRCKDPGTY